MQPEINTKMTTLEGSIQSSSNNNRTTASGGSSISSNNMKDTAISRISNDNEDNIIFESMNEELANSFAERIKDAIRHGIQTLPLLNDEEKCNFLQETIEEKYMRSVDIIEAYGGRNVFTIRQHPSDRRKQIIDAFLQNDVDKNNNNPNNKENQDDGGSGSGNGGDAGNARRNITNTENDSSENPSSSSTHNSTQAEDEGEKKEPSSSESTTYQYPSKEDIPSLEDMESLQEELSTLKEELKTLQERQQQLRVDKASIETAQRVSLQSVDTIQKIDESVVQESVTKAVTGGQEIQELTQQGEEVISNLDETKKARRQRDDVDDDDNNIHEDDIRGGEDSILDYSLPSTRETKKKKRRSLDDEYHDDRKVVLSTAGSINSILRQLKGK